MGIAKTSFGFLDDGTPVDLYTLTNAAGMEARVMTYGAALQSLLVPSAGRAERRDVVLGFDSLAEYVADSPYFGATVGRFAGLIAHGRFVLDGVTQSVTCNEGAHHQHGGRRGFDKVVWQACPDGTEAEPELHLAYLSPHGEEGFPGNLRVIVTYGLTRRNELTVDYAARSDRPTVVNLTHHSYFNLAGQAGGDILGHELMLAAEMFQPIDPVMLPLRPDGPLASVAGTPLDFRTPKTIGRDIEAAHEQIRNGRGFDHNFVLNGPSGTLRLAARAASPDRACVLEVETTEPGMQFYSGNLMRDGLPGKHGAVYRPRHGFCLEAQHYPDSPNCPDYPSTVLRPGQAYNQTTVYRFSGPDAPEAG